MFFLRGGGGYCCGCTTCAFLGGLLEAYLWPDKGLPGPTWGLLGANWAYLGASLGEARTAYMGLVFFFQNSSPGFPALQILVLEFWTQLRNSGLDFQPWNCDLMALEFWPTVRTR